MHGSFFFGGSVVFVRESRRFVRGFCAFLVFLVLVVVFLHVQAAAHLRAIDLDVDQLVKHTVGIAGADEAIQTEADEDVVHRS